MASFRRNVRLRGAQNARVTPSAVAARAGVPAPTQVGQVGGESSGLVFSPSYIQSLPTSGPAWTYMKGIADGNALGSADVSNQNNFFQIWLLANAFVYARTQQQAYKDKVVLGLRQSIGTEDKQTSGQGTILGVVRTVAPLVIAADLVDMDRTLTGLTSYTTPQGVTTDYRNISFESWLDTLRTKRVGTHSKWTDLKTTTDTGCTNFAGFGRGTRVAISAYLEDDNDIINSCVPILQRFCGDRTKWQHWDGPSIGLSWQPSYVLLAEEFGATPDEQTTAIRFANYVGIGEFNNIGGLPYDGIIVGDIARDNTIYDGNYGGVDWDRGGDYAFSTITGTYVAALILEHKYGYDDVWDWSNQALKRCIDWMNRAGNGVPTTETQHHWVPFVSNAKYPGAGHAESSTGAKYGRNFGFTDWLFG